MRLFKRIFTTLTFLPVLLFLLATPVFANPYSGGWSNCTYGAWQAAYEQTGIQLPGWGNAGTWYDSAANAGFSVGTTPRAKSIAVWTDSGAGHVAYVSAIDGDRMYIHVYY